jgi:outer membrane protein OmpA-like peptidoglycan-associated protein
MSARVVIAGLTAVLLSASAYPVLPAKAETLLLAQTEGGVQDQNSQQDQGSSEEDKNRKKRRKQQQEQQQGQGQPQVQQQGGEEQGGQGETKQQRRRRLQQEQQQQGQGQPQLQQQGGEEQGGQGETKQQRRRRLQQEQQQQQQQTQGQPQLQQQGGEEQGGQGETQKQRRRRLQQQQQQQGQDQLQGQPGQPEPQFQGQPQQQQPQQARPSQQQAPEGEQAGTRDAMRFLSDRRPARSLSDAELRRRIAAGQALLGNRDLRDKVRGRVQSLLGEAQNEMASRDRQAGQGQGQPGGQVQQGGQAVRGGMNQPSGQGQSGGMQQGNIGQGQGQGIPQGGGQQAVSDPGRYMADRRPAATLNDQELRQRIRSGRFLLQSDSGQGQRGQIEARLNEDRNELRNRLQEVNGGAVPGGALDQPSAAEGEGRRILSDRRPSNSLDDGQLRDRVQRTRGVLAAEGLSNDMSERLRDRLRDDRDELRNRVSMREERQRDRDERADERDEGPFDYGGRGHEYGRDELTRRLLEDRRPSQALNVRQLNRRIDAARMVLDDRNLRGPDRYRIEDGLQSDRRALRMRLIAGRRDRYDEYRREGGLNVVIMAGAPPRPRPNIAAAEVDDDMIEEQLIAPPTREIDRRYTVDEIRERPALRQTMPGVEIDTIHFGFNEAFVREEEIENLERIGRIIEKIVIANPGEVFMIEGHTDAVGSDTYNIDLSQKRADSVKQSLTEFFNIAPQNLETIGYGEQFLKIPTEGEEPENRRVTVRRITPLLAGRQ